MPPDDGGRVLAQPLEVIGSKRRGCADNVSTEADHRCHLHRQQVGTHDILDVRAPIEELVDL